MESHKFTSNLGDEVDHCSVCGGGKYAPIHAHARQAEDISKAQSRNLEAIIKDFKEEVSVKYTKGVKEHGGNLWEKSELYFIEEAMQEAVDLYVYLHTLRDKIRAREAIVQGTAISVVLSSIAYPQYPNRIKP